MQGNTSPKQPDSGDSGQRIRQKNKPRKSTTMFLRQFARAYSAPIRDANMPGIVLN